MTGRRLDVLDALRAATEPLSIAEIADGLSLHPNTVRFHLDGLIDNGQAERAPVAMCGPGRPALRFRPVEGMDPTGPRRFGLLAEILVDELASGPEPSRRAVSAGRSWGRRLDLPRRSEPMTRRFVVDDLVEVLDELGFRPERGRRTGSREEINLRHCPFLELTATRAAVVCPVHLGLMRGILESWQAPVTVDRLEPYVRPDLCVAHLSPAGAAR